MTDEAKEQVTARLLEGWKRNPKLRLGQLLYCVLNGDGDALFNVEDTDLAQRMESWEP